MRATTALGLVLLAIGLAVIAYRALGLGGSLTYYAISVGSRAIGKAGLAAVAGLMTAESAAIPIPSEVVVPLAGAYYRTPMGLAAVILASTAGNLAGATALYYVGLLGGRPAAYRYASALGLSQGRLSEAEALFARRGFLIVLIGMVMPTVRSFISLPAGVFKMDLARFLMAIFVGSLLWNTVLAVAGYLLGQVAATDPWLDYLAASIAVGLGALLISGRLSLG